MNESYPSTLCVIISNVIVDRMIYDMYNVTLPDLHVDEIANTV